MGLPNFDIPWSDKIAHWQGSVFPFDADGEAFIIVKLNYDGSPPATPLAVSAGSLLDVTVGVKTTGVNVGYYYMTIIHYV